MTRPRRRRSPVTVVRPDPRLWQTALQLAGGDPSLITVLSPTRLEVRDWRYNR